MQKKKERCAPIKAFGKNLWQLGEPSEAGFNVPIKVFEILIHVRKMPLLKDSLRQ